MLENQIAAPPVNMIMNPANDIYSVVSVSLLVLFTLWTLRECWRVKSPMYFLILLGGTLCFLQEPIVDQLGNVWYPDINVHGTIFRAFNVSLPIWVLAGYGLYVGAVAILLFRMMDSGITRKNLWIAYFTIWILSLCVELPQLKLGTYIYFADLPLKIFGFPVTWAMTNGTIMILSAALLTGYREFFTGWRMMFVPLVVTMANGAMQAANGYPVFLAMNTNATYPEKWIATLLTIGFCFFSVHLISLKVCTESVTVRSARPVTV